MKIETEMNSGSKWRRSLMALAVLSAPVVSVAGFSGTANAGGDYDNLPVGFTATAVADCAATPIEIDITINVPSDTYQDRTWDISIEGTSWENNWSTKNGNPASDTSESGSWVVPDAQDGQYEVVIDLDANSTGNPADDGPGGGKTITVNVDCNVNFDDTDAFDVVTNCSPSAGITVTVFSKSKNAPYTLVVDVPDSATNSEVPFQLADFLTDDGGTPKVYSGSKTFSNGQGVYVVSVVHNQSEKTLKLKNVEQTGTYTVNCTPTPPTSGPGGGYNFNLPKLTTPKLPTTGSDSSTSLLVIAPMMVLLGAGLIAARRRLATV